MQKLHFKTKDGRDDYLLLENSEIVLYARSNANSLQSKIGRDSAWYGCDYTTFMKRVATGDDRLVQESDDFLSSIEDQIPVSLGWRNVDDVVGAVPNVPAFLAGHPQCMRRRQRTWKESSPIAIFMDTTSSGGISQKKVEKRGVVLLALTRMLVEHRPVELWVGAALGRPGVSGTVAWRIDTAPLDLARSAFHIGATVMSRGFGYGICMDEFDTSGSWPFGNYSRHVETAKARLAPVFQGQQILYIPPIMLNDPLTDDPVGWLKRTMAEYIGGDDE